MIIKLKDIKLDKELTPRGGVNESIVGIYENSFDKLPAIDMFWIEKRDGWWLVDGWHRYEAAKNLGKVDIKANEHQGTFDDAKEFSFDSNLKHGQPLTLSERKEATKLKLNRYTERSDNWIGEDCGISSHTVRAIREELEEHLAITRCLKFKTKDNRWYPRELEKKVEDKPKIELAKIYQGDMLGVLPKIKQKFDLVIADPPYNVTAWNWDKQGKPTEFLKTCGDWLATIKASLKEKYHLFWFCAPVYAGAMEDIFRELELPVQSRLVWHRRNMAKGSQAKYKFIDTWEMIIHAGNKALNVNSNWTDAWFDVQIFAVPQTNFDDKKLHPTQKPYGLIRRFVEMGSDLNSKILDPFAGAGTTGAACQQDDRQCSLIEIDSGHVTTVENRLKIKRQKL